MPPHGSDQAYYIRCFDLDASAREPYGQLDVQGVRRILHSGDPAVLHEVAGAWGALADRMEDAARLLKSRAERAAEAWQGGAAAAEFQQRVSALRGQATSLASVATAMQRMVAASADTLERVRSHFVDSDEHAYNPSTYHNNDHAKDSLRHLGEGYEHAIRTNLITEVPTSLSSSISVRQLDTTAHGAGPGGVPPLVGPSGPGALLPSGMRQMGSAGVIDGRVSDLPDDPGAGPTNPAGWTGAGTMPGSPGSGGGALADPIDVADSGPDQITSLAGFGQAGFGGLGGGTSGDVASLGGESSGPVAGFGGAGSGSGPGVPGGASGLPVGATPGALTGAPGGRAGQRGRAPGGMFAPGGPGGSGGEEERTRSTWLAEDHDVWGAADLEASPPVLGESPRTDEPDEECY